MGRKSAGAMCREPAVLTAAEVAVLLRISRSGVYALTGQGLLPAVRIGGQLRYRRQDIEALLAGGGTVAGRVGPRAA